MRERRILAASWCRRLQLEKTVSTQLDERFTAGYTFGMKVAVSIPDCTFANAEAFARRRSLSRSRVYAKAIDEYLARYDDEDLTAMANAIADAMTQEDSEEQDAWLRVGAETVLKNTEW